MQSSIRVEGPVVEDEVELTLEELSRACRAGQEQIHVWVVEGVLKPRGSAPTEWRFAGASLKRARVAQRLARDLEINDAGVALALDLLDEIEALHSRLRRLGG